MCNANHHPPECMCGWGGEGHKGRRSPSGFFTIRSIPRVPTRSRLPAPPKYRTVESFTIPNATCPVCGDRVFFYQAPDGGRVFFDDLGPPWPKHPCTDNTFLVPRTPSVWPRIKTSGARLVWKREGWEPFLCREIRAIPSMPGWFRLTGSFRGQGKNFFAQADQEPSRTLFHVRSRPTGGYEISYFEFKAEGVTERRLAAHDSLPPPNHPSSSQDRESPSALGGTAIALALSKARSHRNRKT